MKNNFTQRKEAFHSQQSAIVYPILYIKTINSSETFVFKKNKPKNFLTFFLHCIAADFRVNSIDLQWDRNTQSNVYLISLQTNFMDES